MSSTQEAAAAGSQEVTAAEVEAPRLWDLKQKPVTPISNWHGWLKLWSETNVYQELLGLLHVGFDVSLFKEEYNEPDYKPADRVIFYLQLAEGWNNENLLRVQADESYKYSLGYGDHGEIKKSRRDLRKDLAGKAFAMLCVHFFKERKLYTEDRRDDKVFSGCWQDYITSEELFPAIQHFFRTEKRARNEIPNLNRLGYRDESSHQERKTVGFLLNLARFMWLWRNEEPRGWVSDPKKEKSRREATEKRLTDAKPWMLEVLSAIGEIGLLKEFPELDEVTIAKLEEIALGATLERYRHPVLKDRPVVSLEEAFYAGSTAAEIVIGYREKEKVKRRLEKKRELELKQAEIERELAASDEEDEEE